MKVIYNRLLPFKGYAAMNLFGLVFARKEAGELTPCDRNHEYIHTLQQRELLYVFFYLLYLCEWLFWLMRYRKNWRAYRQISFEREAYRHQGDLEYRSKRKCYAWLRGEA